MIDKLSAQQRMLLASVISILFFVVYIAFFAPKPAPVATVEQNQTQLSQQAPVVPQAQSTAPAAQNVATAPIGNAEATLVTLKSAHYTLKIDALGRISSKELYEKRYLPEGATKLEMISQTLPKPLEMRFNTPELNNEAFKVAYTASISEATITADAPVDVVLTQQLSGVTVTKKLRFYEAGNYDIDVSLSDEKAYSIATGFQPNINLDGFTLHGVLVEQGNDILTIIEDGEAGATQSFNDVKLASSFDRYYANLFFTNDANMRAIIAPTLDGQENPMLFIEGKPAMQFHGYVGPKEYRTLKAIDPLLVDSLEYGYFTFISAPIFWLLDQIHSVVGNWGWAIVLLTIMIRFVLYPLSHKGMVSMQRLKVIAPQMKELQRKHKGEPQKLNAAMMELYKKHGANPLGGCLPMILQIPIFFAIYRVLLNSIELQGAPWILWIEDLAVMDPYFVLPLIMGATMYYQQKITPTNFTDPLQEKMFKYLPIVFTFFFIMFPAGLTLYWAVNNLFSILQQWVVNKQFASAQAKKSVHD
ncbi:MAG: insertase [Sulfuricurvum sp. PC08-66]|nr:MAG: insertase [Sulfuricurvum sp. PC08-66]